MPDKEPNGSAAYSTFTNTPPRPPVDLKELQKHAGRALQSLKDTFKGIRIVVDSNLRGNAYYCAVSQEIYDELTATAVGEDNARQGA